MRARAGSVCAMLDQVTSTATRYTIERFYDLTAIKPSRQSRWNVQVEIDVCVNCKL